MKRKSKIPWKSTAAGFTILYLATVGLSTFLVKEQFVQDYRQRFTEAAISILQQAVDKEWEMEETDWSPMDRTDFYQHLANENMWRADSDALEISIAAYDQTKQLLARSRDYAGATSVQTGSTAPDRQKRTIFPLDDYLSLEEKEQLASCKWKAIQSSDLAAPDKFRFSIRVSPDARELWAIYVQELTWAERENYKGDLYTDPLTGASHFQESGVTIDYATGQEIGEEKTYCETDSRILWQWTNPDVDELQMQTGGIASAGNLFPYMDIFENGSYDRWHRWTTSPYLQGFPQKQEFLWNNGVSMPPLMVDEDGLFYRARYQLKAGMVDAPSAYMEIRMESRPWLDAVRYMKYVYMAGLLLTLASMASVIHAFRKAADRQARLEETRRDFTNAMAHELKTPLGVIRNFSENLLEHNMEEKRDYYLTQIIGQTEEMDQMVLKMIEVSKLDSESLILKKEPVSFAELIKKQLARFEPMILEKHLQVQIQEDSDFQIRGDREYLEKAVWNLLSNAIEHNLPEGRIRILLTKESCTIANTSQSMTEEQLLHAFDLLYTGDKSRGGTKRHLGMGLYLAKKILKLHGLELTLENRKDEVQAVIK